MIDPAGMRKARPVYPRIWIVVLLAGLVACESVAPLYVEESPGSGFLQNDVRGLTVEPMPWASASASKQEARYSCQIAVLKRDPASDSLRYHYGRLNLHFDDEVVERASGPAASWRYRVPMEGDPERMVLAMNCIIPMSRETSEMMSQVVGHERRTDD